MTNCYERENYEGRESLSLRHPDALGVATLSLSSEWQNAFAGIHAVPGRNNQFPPLDMATVAMRSSSITILGFCPLLTL